MKILSDQARDFIKNKPLLMLFFKSKKRDDLLSLSPLSEVLLFILSVVLTIQGVFSESFIFFIISFMFFMIMTLIILSKKDY